MAQNTPYAWEQRPEYIRACQTIVPPGRAVAYYPPRRRGVDAGDVTSFQFGQAMWSENNLPDILYQLLPDRDWTLFRGKPVHSKRDANGNVMYEQWPEDPQSPRALRYFPVLANIDQICTQEHPLIIEAWRRLDPRIEASDIEMRTQWHGRPNWRSMVNILSRWREDYSLLSWHGRKAILSRRLNQQVYGTLNPVQINNNTTRGSTPGLINPAMGPLSPSVPLQPRGPDEGFPRRAAIPNNFFGLTRHIMPPTNQAAPAQQGTTVGAYTTFPQTVYGGPSSGQVPTAPSIFGTTRGGRGASRAFQAPSIFGTTRGGRGASQPSHAPGTFSTTRGGQGVSQLSQAPTTFGTTIGGRRASQPSQATAEGSSSGQTQTGTSTSKTTRSGRLFGKRTVRPGEQDQASDADDDDDDDEQYRSDHEGRSRPASAAPTRPASPLPPMDESYTNSANEYLTEHGVSPLRRHEESRLFRRARERAEPAPPGRDTVEGFSYPAGLFDTDRQTRPGNDPFTWPTPNITTTASIDPVTGARIVIRRPGQLQSPSDAVSQPKPPNDSQSRRRNEDL